MKESGHISIHAQNILPIIKKWLYSEKEIFVRELVSNAADAILKLQKLSLVGEVTQEIPEAKITVGVDKEKGTVWIKDTGLGMTADEIKKYINQVAFSGVSDFLEKYKDQDSDHQVIGHFGLGFYSAFMVAKKVEIDTLSYKEGSKAAHWSCDGSTEFELSDSDRTEIGTTITLHIADDAGEDSADSTKQMLQVDHIQMLLMRYCAFIRFPIELEGKVVNDPKPLWTKSPSTLNDKDYLDFFHKLFPASPDPLFWIHLNVDHPFNLKGILYFPKLAHELDASQGEIKLYCNQVYVADNIKELIPEFLTLLKGVVDCPDMPLNVSRSYLQNDPVARKISEHITKKVADKLTGLAKTEREAYQKYWEDIHPFVKFGMLRDHKFAEKLQDHVLFKASSGDFYTVQEYLDKMKDRLEENTVLYASDPKTQASYLTMLREHDLDAVIADTMIDSHFIPFLESQLGRKVHFKRVDSDVTSHLIDKKNSDIVLNAQDQKTSTEAIEKIFRDHLEKTKVKVRVEALKSEKVPAMLLGDEFSRRMRDMTKSRGGSAMASYMAGIEPEETLLINKNSPAIKNLLRLSLQFNRGDDVKMLVNQIYDLAWLQQGSFTAEMMQNFVDRTSRILGRYGSMDEEKKVEIVAP